MKVLMPPFECGNHKCEPGELSDCPSDCQTDTVRPVIEIGTYNPLRCDQNIAPPGFPNPIGQNEPVFPLNLTPSIKPSKTIDKLQKYSQQDMLETLECVHWIPPGTTQPQQFFSGSRYIPFGRRFSTSGYPLVIKVQDDRKLKMIEVEDLQTGKVLLTEIFSSSGPSKWPQESQVICGFTTKIIFGQIIPVPKYCRVDYKELIIPLSDVCKNGKAQIRLTAVDVAGNVSQRLILFQPTNVDGQKPRILTSDLDILPINHFGFQHGQSNGTMQILRRPVLMSGDDLFFDFQVESENSLKSVRVELQTKHQGQPAGVDVLYEETLDCPACLPADPDCREVQKRFQFQNLNSSYTASYRASKQPSVLGDRTLFYNGIPQGNVRITLTDADGRQTLKDLPVVFLPNASLRNWLKNITGKNQSRGPYSTTLLDQEGFFVNFDNSRRADGDFIWWKSPFTSWSFIKTYFQTHYNSNGKKISWKNTDKTEVFKKVAICAAIVGMAIATDGLGISLLAVYECELANYILWAPTYAKVLNKMSAWCTGFSIAFQMWRHGKIKWSDFSSCNYYQSGTNPPTACDDTMRGSCYFECCRNRDENNKCTDSITENDLMLYLAGMQGKGMTGEFLNKYLDFARFKDDHLMGFPSLFFPGICTLPENIKGSTTEWSAFYNNFFLRWTPRERENWLVENCQDNPQRIIQGSSILTMADSTTGEESHSIVPIRMQHTGDTDRLYVYDPNREYLSYGMRCLRPFDPSNPMDTVDIALTSWMDECGSYIEGTETDFYTSRLPTPTQKALNWKNTEPEVDLNNNSFREIFNYLDLDIRNQKYIYDEYKKYALVTTPHQYMDIPVSTPNLLMELGDELGDWVDELFDKKKIQNFTNDPEIPTRLPLPGLSDEIKVLVYLHTEPPEIRRTMSFPAGKSSFYYAQYGKHLGVSVEAEPTESTSITSTVNKEDRSINISAESGVDELQLKSMTFFQETLKTIHEENVLDENKKKIVHDYRYLIDAQISSEVNSNWKLKLSWDKEKNILVENTGENSLVISANLHTSYLPYLPELKNMKELEQIVELFTKNNLPLERTITFAVPGNSKMKILVDNWRKLSTTKFTIQDQAKPATNKTSGCATSGLGKNSQSQGFLFLIVLFIFVLKRPFSHRNRKFLLSISLFFIFNNISCNEDKETNNGLYGTNIEIVENYNDGPLDRSPKGGYFSIDFHVNSSLYDRCFISGNSSFGLVPLKIKVFSEGAENILDIDQNNINTIIQSKYELNNFSFYIRYNNSPTQYPYETPYSIFEGKTDGWFDSQTLNNHRNNALTANKSTTYLEIESEEPEISVGFEWDSPVFGRFEKPEAIYVLEKK